MTNKTIVQWVRLIYQKYLKNLFTLKLIYEWWILQVFNRILQEP